MSLDITIFDADRFPKKQVHIGVDEHYRLIQIADENACHLLTRINDYYADIEFKNTELDILLKEIIAVRTRCGEDRTLFPILDSLTQLVELAKREGKSLFALAD